MYGRRVLKTIIASMLTVALMNSTAHLGWHVRRYRMNLCGARS